MTTHTTGTQEQWRAARLELLAREKELTRRSDEVARQRLALPWVPIEKDYRFETDAGTKTLAELFDGRSQLLVYHFMFTPLIDGEGCPSCSCFVDQFDGSIVHLEQHDISMICVSRAPLEKLRAYKQRMGWGVEWVSSLGSDFNYDFGVSFTDEQQAGGGGAEYNFTPIEAPFEELPGLSAFALADGVVHHTYSAYARGVDALPGLGQLLDRAPLGRNEGSPPDNWVRRHDEYGA